MPSRIARAGFEMFLRRDISSIGRTRRAIAAFAAVLVVLASVKSADSATCPDEQQTRQVPGNPALCDELEPIVRQPSSLSLDEYEAKLGEYLRNFCHRDLSKGWKVDKRLRNTGPFIGPYQNGKWSEAPLSFGTHAPVLVWYSPEMYRWLKANRPETGLTPAQEDAVPDGAMMVKEMYPPPAARCGEIAWERLRPISEGAAVMVRDSRASHDGWFWGSFDWTDTWQPDWPNQADARKYPYMGFGLYCANCHSSAKNATFAARRFKGSPASPSRFSARIGRVRKTASGNCSAAKGRRSRKRPPLAICLRCRACTSALRKRCDSPLRKCCGANGCHRRNSPTILIFSRHSKYRAVGPRAPRSRPCRLRPTTMSGPRPASARPQTSFSPPTNVSAATPLVARGCS
jgi:Cytochrome P460